MIKIKPLIKEDSTLSKADLDFANKQISDEQERQLWIQAVEARNKYQSTKQYIYKDIMNRTNRELEKYRRNKQKEKLNINVAKAIFKSHGLTATKHSSTAIRGFTYASGNSYEISKYNPGSITLHGIQPDRFNSIISDLKAQGFKLENEKLPSKSIAGGSVASFTIVG
jgi:hypothetical protein